MAKVSFDNKEKVDKIIGLFNDLNETDKLRLMGHLFSKRREDRGEDDNRMEVKL